MNNYGKLVIELHDADVDNEVDGTLLGWFGRRANTMTYAYQAEMTLQDNLDYNWRRAYLKAGGQILVVWECNVLTGIIRYLARDVNYDGEWELPFVASSDARIAVGTWGVDATTDDGARDWAWHQLATAITAILLEGEEIRFAWELVDGVPQIVSHKPPKGR